MMNNTAAMAQTQALAKEQKLEGVMEHLRAQNLTAKNAIEKLRAEGEFDGRTAAFATEFAGFLSSIQIFNDLVGMSRELVRAYSL